MSNKSQTKKKNGPRNRNRRNSRQATIADLLSILPAASLASTHALSAANDPKRTRRTRAKPKLGRKVRQNKGMSGVAPLPPSVREFLAYWHPFTEQVPLPFHTSNIEQTISSRGMRYTISREVACPPNSTTWIMLGTSNYTSVDSTASHVESFTQNAVRYVIGPVRYNALEAGVAAPITSSIGQIVTFVGNSNAPITRQLGGSSSGGTLYNQLTDDRQAWPVVSTQYTDAIRWCPLSFGVDLRRVGPALESGGDWVSITPAAAVITSGVYLYKGDLATFPSYTKHGSERCHVELMARPHDMAFQHIDSVFQTATFDNPAILLCFTNNTSYSLSYDMSVSAKYAVAGSANVKLLSPMDASPAHAQILNVASTAVTSGVAPGHAATALAEAAHSAISTGKSALSAVQMVGQKFKEGASMLAPLASAAGFSLAA